MKEDTCTRELMGEAKFYEGYSRWNEDLDRYETWDEAVDRVMEMHYSRYKEEIEKDTTGELVSFLKKAEKAYKEKKVLGAQRALQFGGEQIVRNNMRLYNCSSSYADRPEFFGEFFWILLAGCGAGFSVQKHHVKKLPKIALRKGHAKVYVVEDSIEGWAGSLDILMSSFFVGGGKHPEYEGRRVYFDLSQIRPKGALISGGFKAPGPEPLRRALDKIEHMLQGAVLKNQTKLKPIEVYDICMHASDAVLSGGVRRSATICMFSPDDKDMANAKTGNWLEDNPQRARSNNSMVLLRNEATREKFHEIMNSIKQFGEPGFVFADSTEHTFNPCAEIGKYPVLIDKKGRKISGWQLCNLCEINGAECKTAEDFLESCVIAAVMGTIQAGYTNFPFLDDVSKQIIEREALLGVSITGWMNSPDLLFDEELLKKGATLVKETNKKIAKLIGINPAARTTCVKPAGNVSVILGTASGIHGDHSKLYLRNMQMNKEQEVADLLKERNSYMIEDSIWSENRSDYVISFPIIAPKNSLFKKDLYGIKLLDKIKMVQKTWIEYGKDESLCVDPTCSHNVSNTVQVEADKWDEIADYLFDNRKYFTCVSLLPVSGDKDYYQAPFVSILTEDEIFDKYGRAALFASGLIVEATKGFDNLWTATRIAQFGDQEQTGEQKDLGAEWVRRFHKFAENYFDGDLTATANCLKDVTLLHKWTKIQKNLKSIDFKQELQKRTYTEIDTTGAIACHGGVCEI